jgi:hypothetical protein
MRRPIALSLVLALVLATAIALSGCAQIAQKATQAAVEKTTGVKVDTNSGTITTTDKQGNTATLSTSQGTYPQGFPADFPQYPNGVVSSALTGSTGGKASFTLIVRTPDAPKDVYAYYLTELEKAGWTIKNKMDGTTSESAFANLTAEKTDLAGGVTLSRSKDATATDIMIGLGPVTK